VFFGTPAWAVPSLERLLQSDVEVAAVVTNPDRPAGRGMELRASPVKEAALQAGLRVLQPERARDPELMEELERLDPDVATVVAYGKILPVPLLEVPARGFVNVHFSLLPLYRGAAPVQRAVMDGRSETGVSIMVLTEGMDEGPVLARKTVPIGVDDTAGSVGEKLSLVGADLLVETLPAYIRGAIEPEPQQDVAASYAPKIGTDEARIDWTLPADRIRDHVRGLNPVPGAWTALDDARLKVWGVEPSSEPGLAPGAVRVKDGLHVGTGDEALRLSDVQLQGKRRMGGDELARGLRVGPATYLR
jgi:methionyl-tRNA formyltransferase